MEQEIAVLYAYISVKATPTALSRPESTVPAAYMHTTDCLCITLCIMTAEV